MSPLVPPSAAEAGCLAPGCAQEGLGRFRFGAADMAVDANPAVAAEGGLLLVRDQGRLKVCTSNSC